MTNERIIKRLSRIGIFGNIFLTVFKLIAGILGKSSAMVSDAVHSFSDVFATVIAYIGVKISGKSADEKHPYGHERFECIASLALGLILAGTGVTIGFSGIKTIISGSYATKELPTLLPLIAAVISIVSKEAMYHYTMHYARQMKSVAFEADAWHHRSDALSSIGSFVGIGAVKLGFPIMDSIASVVICLCILKVAGDILSDSVRKLLDTSCSQDYEEQIAEYIKKDDSVESLDLLRTRMFGNVIYADVEISVARESSLVEAHEIAERIHEGIEKEFPDVKHVMIHVNPGV